MRLQQRIPTNKEINCSWNYVKLIFACAIVHLSPAETQWDYRDEWGFVLLFFIFFRFYFGAVILSSEAHLSTHCLILLNEPFKQFNFNYIKYLKGSIKTNKKVKQSKRYLSRWSLWASILQSFPLVCGASRLPHNFCLMDNGIRKALGPIKVVMLLAGSIRDVSMHWSS